MILATLLLSASVETRSTQQRVDKVVQRCHATKVVQLLAQSHREVVISMQVTDRAPTSDEDAKFSCVLAAMRKMDGLTFGFIGNEATPSDQ